MIELTGRVLDLRGQSDRGRATGIVAGQCGRPLHARARSRDRAARSRFPGLCAPRHRRGRRPTGSSRSSPAAMTARSATAPPHLHFDLRGRTHRSVAQMYFPEDAEGNAQRHALPGARARTPAQFGRGARSGRPGQISLGHRADGLRPTGRIAANKLRKLRLAKRRSSGRPGGRSLRGQPRRQPSAAGRSGRMPLRWARAHCPSLLSPRRPRSEIGRVDLLSAPAAGGRAARHDSALVRGDGGIDLRAERSGVPGPGVISPDPASQGRAGQGGGCAGRGSTSSIARPSLRHRIEVGAVDPGSGRRRDSSGRRASVARRSILGLVLLVLAEFRLGLGLLRAGAPRRRRRDRRPRPRQATNSSRSSESARRCAVGGRPRCSASRSRRVSTAVASRLSR